MANPTPTIAPNTSTQLTQGQPFIDANGNPQTAEYDPNNGSKLAAGQTVQAPTISADGLSTTVNPPVTTTPPPLTGHVGLTGMVTSNNDQILQKYATDQQNTDAAKSAMGSDSSDITKLMNQIGGIKQQEDQVELNPDLVAQQTQILKLSNQITAANKATTDEVNLIQQQNPDGFMGTAGQDHINDIQRQNANYVANLSIQQSALQGNYTQLVTTATKALNAQLEPLQAALQARQFTFQNNKDLFTTAQGQQLKDQDAQIQELRTQNSSAISNISTLMQNGTVTPQQGTQAISDILGGKKSLSDIYNSIGQYSAGTSAGTVGGVDLSSHATDPNYSIKVSAIYNNTPTITDAASAQSAIDATKLSSPITGQQLMDAATKYNTDPRTLLAMMQQESSLGTSSVAKTNNNPTGITWSQAYQDSHPGVTKGSARPGDEGGNYVKFNSMQDGINASAEWNSKHAATVPTYAQYGLLSNTSFNPNNSQDNVAFNYIKQVLAGNLPVASTIGISTRGGSGQTQLANAQKRASDLYFQATGQPLPNTVTTKSNLALISANNKIANNLSIQDQTVIKNFQQNVDNLTKNNIDKQAMPVLNTITNWIQTALGNPATGALIAQNTTIQNELGSLLALKNASGTTVHDKLESAGLIGANDSIDVQKAKLKAILGEAANAKTVLQGVNSDLYNQTDPLQIDANNPNRQSAKADNGTVTASNPLGLTFN